MTEQIRVVLMTYSQRTAFRAIAAAILPILLLSYKLSFASFLSNPALGYLILTGPFTTLFFVFLGHHLKLQFASFRSKLTPGFAFAHLAVALMLISIVAIFMAGFAATYTHAVHAITGSTPQVEPAGVLSILWATILLGYSAGYFFSPAASWSFLLLLPLLMSSHSLGQLISEPGGKPAIAILLMDAIGTLMLVKRMFVADESKFEYKNKDESRESQRYWWSKNSDGGWLQRLFERRSASYLDRIQPPLPNSFLHQVRHFEHSSATARQSLASTTVFLVIVLWGVNWMTSGVSAGLTGLLSFLTIFPALSIFSWLFPFQKRSLQSLFMLPMEKHEIVSRYGCALFAILMKNWLSYAAAGVILAWMPLPAKFQGIPSIAPLVTSLTVQLPIFGVFSLAIGRSRGILVGIAISTAFLFAFGSFALPRLLPAIAVPAGILLTWFSYRRWCHAEFVD